MTHGSRFVKIEQFGVGSRFHHDVQCAVDERSSQGGAHFTVYADHDLHTEFILDYENALLLRDRLGVLCGVVKDGGGS